MNKVLMAAAGAGALLVSVSPAAAQQYGRPGYANGYGYGYGSNYGNRTGYNYGNRTGYNYGNRTGYADNGYARRGDDWDQDENYRSYRRHDHHRRHRDRDDRFERHGQRDRDGDDR